MKAAVPPADVLVTVRFFDEVAVQTLERRGHRVLRADVAYDQLDTEITPGIEATLGQVQGWIIGAAPVTRALLERHPHLKIVARRGVGFDTVDVQAIGALGRILSNTPGGNEPAVADHALGLMLAVSKRVFEAHQRMRAGDWRAIVGGELHGKTVGIVGMGRIGRLVARRVAGFDAEVLAYDPNLDNESARQAGVTMCSLDDLLRQSDFVSLHAPFTAATQDLIDADALALMKPTAVLVNTSRGELVDEVALLAALREGRLGGAGLDVFRGEREPSMRATAEALLALPNVVGTPHAAASTRESLQRANLLAAECVAAALEGVPLPVGCTVADGRQPK